MQGGEKFNNKYRIKSLRLKDYDYSQDGMYFITICTKDKYHYFGRIDREDVILNKIGKIANEFWQKISEHFPFVEVDAYQIMPNHLHGIIVINRDLVDDEQPVFHPRRDVALQRLYAGEKTYKGQHQKMSEISPKSGSLSTIIRSYKSAVTKESKSIISNFAWQPRFYDHIIRNEKSLFKIREYIVNNPAKWKSDRNNLMR